MFEIWPYLQGGSQNYIQNLKKIEFHKLGMPSRPVAGIPDYTASLESLQVEKAFVLKNWIVFRDSGSEVLMFIWVW